MKVGEMVRHGGTGIVGKVRRFWEPGTYPADAPAEDRLTVRAVELEDGNVLLEYDAALEQAAFEVLSEKEAIYFKQVTALVVHLCGECGTLARALDIEPKRAMQAIASVLSAQANALRR